MKQEYLDLYSKSKYLELNLILESPRTLKEMMLKIKVNTKLEKYDQSLELINVINQTKTLSENEELELAYLQSEVLWLKGNLPECLEILTQYKDKINSTDLTELKVKYLDLKCKIYTDKGEFEKAIEFGKNALILLDDIRSKELEFKVFNDLGVAEFQRVNFDIAKSYFNKALDRINESSPIRDKIIVLNNLGMIAHSTGNVDEAMNYYLSSLDAVPDYLLSDKSMLLNNIAEIHLERGDLEKAYDLYSKALEIDKQVGNKLYIAYGIDNLGAVTSKMGNLDEAYNLHKKAYQYFEELDNEIELSLSFLQLIEISIKMGNLDQAKEFLSKLEQIYQNRLDSDVVKTRFLYSKALTLKHSKRANHKFQSQDLFNQLIEVDTNEIEIIFNSLIYLCDLLIDELQLYGEEEVLEELMELSKKLDTLAEDRLSSSLMIESLVIRSKICLLNLELDQAQSLLEDAIQLAKSENLDHLSVQLHKEYDELLEKFEFWNKMISIQAPLKQRVRFSGFERLIGKILEKDMALWKIEEEFPILFLIISSGGIMHYKYRFSDDGYSNEELLSSVISALNSLSQEVFKTKNFLERVKLGEYNMVFLTDYNTHFVYIFKGYSYFAVNKLEKLTLQVAKKPAIINILKNPMGRDLSSYQKYLDDLTTRIFAF